MVLMALCSLVARCASDRRVESFETTASLQAKCAQIQLPVAISTPQPEWPYGVPVPTEASPVILHGVITTDGRIGDLTVRSSPTVELANLAVKTAQEWRYTPAQCDRTPVRLGVTLTFGESHKSSSR